MTPPLIIDIDNVKDIRIESFEDIKRMLDEKHDEHIKNGEALSQQMEKNRKHFQELYSKAKATTNAPSQNQVQRDHENKIKRMKQEHEAAIAQKQREHEEAMNNKGNIK